jgi:hypothetical protein
LTLLDSQIQAILPPRSQPSYLQAVYRALAGSQAAGSQAGSEASLAEPLQQVAGQSGKRGLIALVSDCFDDPQRLVQALSLFRNRGHEVVVFQVWDPDELDFPFRDRTQFRSLESERSQMVDPRSLRESYLEHLSIFRKQLETACARQRIELVACLTSQHCGSVLAQFLTNRQRTPPRSTSRRGRSSMRAVDEFP